MDSGVNVAAMAHERRPIDCLAQAKALAPVIAAAVPRIEANRELPEDLVDALHKAGLYRMLFPRSLGGQELALPLYIQAIEEIAKADASTAWCVGQSSVCSTITASLDHAAAWEMFGKDQRAVLNWGPQGRTAKAIAAKGGFRITGRWPFASGSRHATWMAAHTSVYEADGETPLRDAAGKPAERTFIFPRASAEIIDNWYVMGLKGTGSDTYTVTNLFVPEERSMTVFGRNPAERREHGPLYLFTVHQMFGATFAGVALGIARGALDAFVELAKTKVPAPTGGSSVLRDNHVIQSQVGVAQTQLASARVFLLNAVEEIWEEAVETGAVSLDKRVALRMAESHATQMAKLVMDIAYHSAGATAIFESNPFERRFRDLHTVLQQVQAHYSVFEVIGKHFLGLPLTSRLV
ncbi:MAG: acyl-CoA dehydrogenase [Rhizobiales bacterium]|nr:acyl-CoA dehydrogenase [Hyphomicrobiales bacterium]